MFSWTLKRCPGGHTQDSALRVSLWVFVHKPLPSLPSLTQTLEKELVCSVNSRMILRSREPGCSVSGKPDASVSSRVTESADIPRPDRLQGTPGAWLERAGLRGQASWAAGLVALGG